MADGRELDELDGTGETEFELDRAGEAEIELDGAGEAEERSFEAIIYALFDQEKGGLRCWRVYVMKADMLFQVEGLNKRYVHVLDLWTALLVCFAAATF